MSTPDSLQSTIILPNGQKMPCIGFGVWASPPEQCLKSCLAALGCGYRHIDTGDCYGNEAEVGQAVRESGIDRKELFLATKVLMAQGSVERSREHILASIQRLAAQQEDAYVDMILIHNAAVGDVEIKELWLALEQLYAEKRIRCIGVSNHGIGHLTRMKQYASVWPPSANQLELHPWCQQREVVAYCRQEGIPVQAYSPLARNTKANDETLQDIAASHGITTAQVLVRWSLQKGFVPLPKSDNPERIAKNAKVFDFTLTDEDMQRLDGLDQGKAGSLVLAVSNE